MDTALGLVAFDGGFVTTVVGNLEVASPFELPALPNSSRWSQKLLDVRNSKLLTGFLRM
jgi:hypothetical protein